MKNGTHRNNTITDNPGNSIINRVSCSNNHNAKNDEQQEIEFARMIASQILSIKSIA